jgi:hypothetical protein
MLRSRLLLRFAAPLALFALTGCHSQSGGDVQSPSSRAETTGAEEPAFPTEDARTALNAASPGLKSCRHDGGPSSLDASVKFEPSGKVGAVDVKPAAEPVASCVRERLAEVCVMPFSGAPVTMSMRIQM